jgi:DNA-binding NtrC family response regulator/CHASE2 domain-containing sensor protein
VRRAVVAACLGLLATVVATLAVVLGGAGVAALGGALRDRWALALAPVSPALTVVMRDAAAEQRLGEGSWDRAVTARVVGALSLGGARAIGLDAPLGQPSAPGRGGVASDALLREAIGQARDIVFLLPAGPGAVPAGVSAGHRLATVDPDRVVRRVPLVARVGDRDVLAFGVVLAATAQRVHPEDLAARIPTGADGRAVLRWAPDLQVTLFSELWTAVERGDIRRVRELADGKVVVLATEPPGLSRPTPIGPLWDVAIQAEVVNAALTGAWLRETPLAVTVLASLLLAVLAAWLALRVRGWLAPIAVVGVVLVYATAFALAPAATGVVLPALVPLAAIVLAGAGGTLWEQLGAGRRVRDLEAEVGVLREALVRRESAVEALQEDVEAARASGAETLRTHLAEAEAQERETRARLDALQRELRPAGDAPAGLADAELERLRRAAAEVGIVTREPGMLALFRDLERAARTSLPIVLAGEAGTGKELFARAAHRLSPRAGRPFVAVNMAAVPAGLFESEMFGHVKGAFTGAVEDRTGLFEQASGGTIFLDEIGELAAEQQSKLLRVLQDKTFQRVGGRRPTAVDVRVVAASNRDLERAVADGRFREDLYFRLKGVVLRLPALRERRRDIALLAAHFLEAAGAEAGRSVSLSEAAVETLEAQPWPGNVRELQNCLRQAVALGDRSVLAPADLRLAPAPEPRADAAGDAAVLACLRQHGFDMQATARALGWDRSTVTQRLKGLGFRALVEAGGDRARAAADLAGDPGLVRLVELKLAEYHQHLLRSVAGSESADAALAACRRRFKNLPERHFRSLEVLVRQHFHR